MVRLARRRLLGPGRAAPAGRRPGLADVDVALSVEDGGLGLAHGTWPTTWFKGGSEPGVFALGYLAEHRDGRVFVAVLLLADPVGALDDAAFDPRGAHPRARRLRPRCRLRARPVRRRRPLEDLTPSAARRPGRPELTAVPAARTASGGEPRARARSRPHVGDQRPMATTRSGGPVRGVVGPLARADSTWPGRAERCRPRGGAVVHGASAVTVPGSVPTRPDPSPGRRARRAASTSAAKGTPPAVCTRALSAKAAMPPSSRAVRVEPERRGRCPRCCW